MKTKHIKGIRNLGLVGLLGLAAVSGFAQEEAATPSELLEEGVYLEEARGDLDAAIAIYQKIVESERASRARAAEAQYRLALCYQKLGNGPMAAQSFEALVNNFPNQTKWVEAALEHLPQPFAPGDIPWVDGEATLLEMKLPTGYHVGYVVYRTELVEHEGRKLWRFTNRTLGGQEVVNMLEVDPETQKPVYGYVFGSNADFGEISYWFENDHVRMLFGSDTDEKNVPIAEGVIDNLQAQYIIRQFPVEVGFSTKQSVFVNISASTIPVVYEIVGIEDVETPIGTFNCTHTEIRLGGQTQHFYTTTDDARRIVKFRVGQVEALAVQSDVVVAGETRSFHNEQMGFTVDLPAEWSVIDLTSADGNENRTRVLIRDSWKPGDLAISAYRQDEVAEDDAARARELAEQNAKSFSRKVGLSVDEASWKSFEVPAGAAVSYAGTANVNGKDVTLRATVVHHGDRTLLFTIRGSADWVEENLAKLEAAARSARFD